MTIETDNGSKRYELHHIFDSSSSQEDVFGTVAKKIVEDCVEGYNGTVFAYGQTGSGKTHTMLGPCDSWTDQELMGLIPRSVEHVFQHLDTKAKECQKLTFSVSVEFVELYNEVIYDLLNAKNKVQLRDSGKDIQLVGALSKNVDNPLDLMHLVQKGWQERSTGSTAMNAESSRSHALLIIRIKTQERTGELVKERSSILNLVDLAGSERQTHTKSSGDRLKEATNINSSLTVLGRCIRLLADPSKAKGHVPYRDSHLTHILKNSLGGNSKTAVIVNMHPDRDFAQESNSTLMFAQSCTMIMNIATRNEVMTGDQESSYKKAIQELRQEVDETREKVRTEFASQLDEAEVEQLRLKTENNSLRLENVDLRAKYDFALLKYTIGSENEQIVNEFKKIISEFSAANSSSPFECIALKNQTLQLEIEASEKRYQELQKETSALRNRYQENLDATILMQTPSAKERRSSSRPKRRETQYRPSPARMALFAEVETSEDAVLDLQCQNEKLSCELSSLKDKHEEATSKSIETERLLQGEIVALQKEVSIVSESLRKSEAVAEGYKEKVTANNLTLDKLLLHIDASRKRIAELELSSKESENRSSEELEEQRLYYVSMIEDLERKASDEYAALREELNQKTLSSNLLQVQVDELQLSNATIKKLNADLSTKAGLIRSLEDSIEKKSQMITRLEEQAVLDSSELSSTKRQLEHSRLEAIQWRKISEETTSAMQTQLKDHQKDIDQCRHKKKLEIQSMQLSLDNANARVKESEAMMKKLQNDEKQKFDMKMSEIENTFKEKLSVSLKKQEDTIRRQSLAENQGKLEVMENKNRVLSETIESLQSQHSQDTEVINAGLRTRGDRVGYVDKLRVEKKALEETISQLRSENDKLKKIMRGESANKPVLRSQTTKP